MLILVEDSAEALASSHVQARERDVSWVIRKAIKEYLDRHEEGSLGKDPDW
jgi:predicted transcriptional regulator